MEEKTRPVHIQITEKLKFSLGILTLKAFQVPFDTFEYIEFAFWRVVAAQNKQINVLKTQQDPNAFILT